MDFFAIADDLTGALEIGAKLADAGLPARVATMRRLAECRQIQAVVADVETRHASPLQASETVRRVALMAGSPALVYKKTDSTLRGNIASELSGLTSVFPRLPVVYVPAYPQMGRTVVGGRLLVDGIPVSRTAFARDPLNPVDTDDVLALLGAQLHAALIDPGQIASVSQPGVYVVNAASESDVREAAEEFCRAGLRLAAGPAGFAGSLAHSASFPRGRPPIRPPARSCLLVNGSLHPRSRAQVRDALGRCRRARSADAAVSALAKPDWVVLDVDAGGSPAEHATLLGKSVRDVLQHADIDALVVFGGDTAFGILRELGEPVLEPMGEVLPGIPAARLRPESIRCRPGGQMLLVAKAGGFGATDVVAALQAALTHS